MENTKGTIIIEDSILVKGVPAAYGSKMLENFTPLFDGEVVVRLKAQGYCIGAKGHVGEFGLDFSGERAYSLKEDISSLIKNHSVDAILSVDVNGSPRRKAALENLKCLKPTYSTVSRYGIIPCACSGEQVTITADTTEKIIELATVISGNDEKDGTSFPTPNYDYHSTKDIKGMKFAIIKELIPLCSTEVQTEINTFCDRLKSLGGEVREISFPEILMSKIAWFILSSAETCNNLSKFDGVKYGHRSKEYKDIIELYQNSRSEGFGLLSKFVILYGSDVLSKERYDSAYDQAMKIRRILQEKTLDILKGIDCLVLPVTSKKSYSEEEMNALNLAYNESLFTSLANLTGVPSLVSNSVQLVGNLFDENTLFSVAQTMERMV